MTIETLIHSIVCHCLLFFLSLADFCGLSEFWTTKIRAGCQYLLQCIRYELQNERVFDPGAYDWK
ncbi:hypothetical protein K440DRAFT_614916 [Wilcoxina mikolae CBS 423.85]|nr:hypothetical protein K440DRAFT_614916 [Wilcoxina mikolae CBS 423.85]